MFPHCSDGSRISSDLDDRFNRVSDNISLSSREDMDGKPTSGLERDTFGGCRGGVHVVQPGSFIRCFGRREDINISSVLANLLKITHRLFFNCGQATFDIALRRLTFRKIACLIGLNNFIHVGFPGRKPFITHFFIDRPLPA